MVKEATTKINRVGPRHTIYLQKDLVEDSTFPFHLNEPLNVRLEGGKLIIERTGTKTITSDFMPNDGEEPRVLDALEGLGFSPVLSRAEKIYEMLKEVHEAETLDLRVKHISPKEHALLLWDGRRLLERVIKEFFDPDMTERASKGLLSEKPIMKGSVENRLYEEFLGSDKQGNPLSHKILGWITMLQNANQSGKMGTRVAIEDLSWFIGKGYENEIIKFEKEIGERLKGEATLLCAYNATAISDKKSLMELLAAHSYVILETPLRVYRKS